jgi:hypothetical protein
MSETMSDEQLAEIRRRNDYLRNIPFDTHGPGIHGDNCPPCGMVRSIGDVTALLEQLRAERDRTALALERESNKLDQDAERYADERSPLLAAQAEALWDAAQQIRGGKGQQAESAPQQPEDGG